MKYDATILRQMYTEYNIFADRLVSNPSSLFKFTVDYSTRTGTKVPAADIGQALLNLRKLGEEKGGLPRLKRHYYGRNAKLKETA